jgi:hypothetical protein
MQAKPLTQQWFCNSSKEVNKEAAHHASHSKQPTKHRIKAQHLTQAGIHRL